MIDKYWAKREYGAIDPDKYDRERYFQPADKVLSEAEQQAVSELIFKYQRIISGRKIQILDVACGTGRLAFHLENHLPYSILTGTDINENMLQGARRNAIKKKSRVKFVKGDIYKLSFGKNKFDVVAGLRFSMHLPYFNKALKELSRVLKEEGLLIFDILNPMSILRPWIFLNKIKVEESGFYTINRMVKLAEKNKFTLLDFKGIWFLGQTIFKIVPPIILPLLYPMITPPFSIQKFSSKIVLCFKKHDSKQQI